jgi:hypothetical protein
MRFSLQRNSSSKSLGTFEDTSLPERTELAQVPLEVVPEGELVLVGIGEAGIDELDLV